jgi:uncharacterized protein
MRGDYMMDQRVQMIDGMRGFSLLGILLANMLIFQYGLWGKDELQLFHLFMGDQLAYTWLKIFVEGSFMPIFMFLFGYSMIKMKEKLEANHGKVKRHFFRRFLLLMVFGFLHGMFLFEGDILLSYGFLGVMIMAFINRKKKTLLIWSISLFVLGALASFGSTTMVEEPKDRERMEEYVSKAINIYSVGSYEEITDFRMSAEDPLGLTDMEYLLLFIIAPFSMFPMFLCGMYAAKSSWFLNPEKDRTRYLWWTLLLVPTCLVLKSVPILFPDSPWSGVAGAFGMPLLGLGYIFAFALLYAKGANPLLRLFEKVGRLSMTNYLLQSVICSTIFYGYGLGFYGKMGVFNGILLSFVIYGLQMIFSHWYITKWKLGPFEWLLRIGTNLTWNGKTKTLKPNSVQVESM